MKKYKELKESLKEKNAYDPSCVIEGLTDTAGGGGAGGSIRAVHNSHQGTDLHGLGDGSRQPAAITDPEVRSTLIKGINLELGGTHSHTVVPIQKTLQKMGIAGLTVKNPPTRDLPVGDHRFELMHNDEFKTGVDHGTAHPEKEMPKMELVLSVEELVNGLGIKADIVTSE